MCLHCWWRCASWAFRLFRHDIQSSWCSPIITKSFCQALAVVMIWAKIQIHFHSTWCIFVHGMGYQDVCLNFEIYSKKNTSKHNTSSCHVCIQVHACARTRTHALRNKHICSQPGAINKHAQLTNCVLALLSQQKDNWKTHVTATHTWIRSASAQRAAQQRV